MLSEQAEVSGWGRVRVQAPAKVNLTLRILERLPSGYHALETLFQAIDLGDHLEVRRADGSEVALRVTGADVGPVDDNLVMRAARGFLAEAPGAGGVNITLTKVVPAGAGLGGGSSDAGATLRALDGLFPGAVPPSRLLELGAALGSDVPFFTQSHGRVLARGRGERMTPLVPLPTAWLLVGLPPVHVGTGVAYQRLARVRDGGVDVPSPLFAGDPLPDAWGSLARVAVNDFEAVISDAYPEVSRVLATIRRTDPIFALLSGSGAAAFGVFPDARAAEQAREEAQASCPEARFQVARTLERLPAVERLDP